MQVIKVEACGIYSVETEMTDGTKQSVKMYYLNGSPNTGVEWVGNSVQSDPFTFGAPWDYIFTAYINKYGQQLVGKEFIFDVDDPDGNIVKVRDGSV